MILELISYEELLHEEGPSHENYFPYVSFVFVDVQSGLLSI